MRRHIAPEDKVRLLLLSMKSKHSVANFCKRYEVSESSYYGWRKIFMQAGTEALRRSPKREERKTAGNHARCEETASVEAAQMDVRQSVVALLHQEIVRRARLPEIAKLKIVDLIDTAPIPKVLAVDAAGVTRSTYYRWRGTIRPTNSPPEQGPAPKQIRLTDRDNVKQLVFKILHSPPSDHGFNRTTWKVDDLQHALKKTDLVVGKHAIRTIIKDAGYRWLKAKKVLTSKDPDYRTKLDNIERVLGGLAKDEGFFSIDEYGPFAVKHRAGRQLVAPGEISMVPQWQRSKGVRTSSERSERRHVTNNNQFPKQSIAEIEEINRKVADLNDKMQVKDMRFSTCERTGEPLVQIRIPVVTSEPFKLEYSWDWATMYMEDLASLLAKGITPQVLGKLGRDEPITLLDGSWSEAYPFVLAEALARIGEGQRIEYIDGNPLNLRRDNLRVVGDQRQGAPSWKGSYRYKPQSNEQVRH